MSASKMPTFRPRSRRPSARLTAVVDLPTPPLPDATAMIEVTPGMPAGDGAVPPSRGRAAPGGICGRRCGAVPPTPLARSAVSATSTDCDARHGAGRGFGAGAHGFPFLHRAGIDADGEKHLAVGDDDVGQRAGLGELLALRARDFGQARPERRLSRSPCRQSPGTRTGIAAVDSLHRPSTGPVNAYPD